MKNYDELAEEGANLIARYRNAINVVTLNVLEHLKSMPRENALEELRGMKIVDLKHLSENMAEPEEYYEVCALVRDVLKERLTDK